MNLVQIMIAFVLAGITLEVFWTSILNAMKNGDHRKLTGISYLWMFPIYATVPLIILFIMNKFGNLNIFLRAIIYMVSFYAIEYISGYIIKKIMGVSPWNYRGYYIKIFKKEYKANYKGLICLEYAPVWYLYGIMGEYFIKFLISLH